MTTPYITSEAPLAPQGRGERPTGVAVLAVLNFAGAGLAVLGAIVAVAFGALFGSFIGGGFGSLAGEAGDGATAGAAAGTIVGAMFAVAFLVGGAIAAVMGYGLWKGMGWAWVLELVFSGLSGISNLLALAQGEYTSILSLGIAAFLIWYLLQPGVKRWFGKA